MVNYPISFTSDSEASSGEDEWSLETGEGLKTSMSVPQDFGGDKTYPSPEDLFSASIQTCMLATFKTVAERKGLTYSRIKVEAEINLDRGEDSRPVMKEGKIDMHVKGIENKKKAEKVAEAAEKNCFIHNSVNTDVRTNFKFTR